MEGGTTIHHHVIYPLHSLSPPPTLTTSYQVIRLSSFQPFLEPLSPGSFWSSAAWIGFLYDWLYSFGVMFLLYSAKTVISQSVFQLPNFFWHFLICCHFFLPFFFFLHIFFCILEFLYCHFRGIWKRRETATCVSSAIFKQMSFQVVCTCVFLFICSVLFCLFIYVNVFSFCLVVFSQLSISASVNFGLGYWLGWLSVPELESAPFSFPTPGMTCCPLWVPRFLALGTR